MGEKKDQGFREFLKGKGVNVSPEFKPRKRISLRDSVRRLREMNLGLAALAAALLAAGAVVWKIEFPPRPGERESAVAEVVFECSPAPFETSAPARPERVPAPVASSVDAAPPPPAAEKPVYHVVRPGDTLIGIAKKHYRQGWRWTEIAGANPQAAADSWKLEVGAKLLIPQLDE